jgi:hypothetical protein
MSESESAEALDVGAPDEGPAPARPCAARGRGANKLFLRMLICALPVSGLQRSCITL